jgi:CHAT domain-containing protein
MKSLQECFACDLLINGAFTTNALEKELRAVPFSMLHIASHGEFDSDASKSFLLTYNGRLSMDELAQYVGLFRFRKEPLELLTLSACETAAGDERAALGLAGLGIKAGARSAVATLWHVNDEASSMLVAEFYHSLQDPSFSRAFALRAAQLKLIQNKSYQHPAYWSPFLLINNWL